jgi:hypothetical protein
MTYTYKYIPSSLSGTPGEGEDPKKQYIDLFQETLNQQFYNSSDWWTIQEETVSGSEVYVEYDVRINHVINAETGLKLGDDWKTILFKNIDHNVELGRHYIFDSNTWLTINTEYIKNLTGTCTVRRCNNSLRWVEETTGVYYEEPCCIEYLVKEPRNYATSGSPFITPGGFLHIEMQFNDRSKLINENQRFLFGNPEHWTCYKVIGTGLGDFKNTKTYDNTTNKVLSVDLIADFVNEELDDVVSGIADVYTNVYTISLDKTTAEGAVAGEIHLTPTITYNGKTVTRTVTWTTSDATIATVNTGGLVTLIKNGVCTITGTIEGNPVHAHCAITVKASPAVNTQVVVYPDINYVLEGTHRDYTVFLYENDTIQADTFTITCGNNNVPAGNYNFSSASNGFVITNVLRSVDSYLTITCTSGSNVKVMNVYLRGGW